MSYYLGLSILSNNEGSPGNSPSDSRCRKGERRKLLSAEARRMLSLLEGRPLEERHIAREAGGRPFFPGGESDFSIAHSGALAAVSHVRGGRTGCDIEIIRPRPGARKIAKEFFSTAEQSFLFYQEGFDEASGFDEAGFYIIWTLKECYLKLRGLSVFDMAAAPSFVRDRNLYRVQAKSPCETQAKDPCREQTKETFTFGAPVFSPLSFYLYELSDGAGKRYMLATAIEGAEQQRPGIQWFSQSFLACKMIAEIKAAPNPAETVRPKI